jgi:hypothetical protein
VGSDRRDGGLTVYDHRNGFIRDVYRLDISRERLEDGRTRGQRVFLGRSRSHRCVAAKDLGATRTCTELFADIDLNRAVVKPMPSP